MSSLGHVHVYCREMFQLVAAAVYASFVQKQQ